MSLWSRIVNALRGERVDQEIDEELHSHVDEAIAQGRDPAEARRAVGSMLRLREQSRDIRLLPWLESLRADVVFAWRQLTKRKITSGAAILSLALAIGACTSAFRLIDALLWRPLPVAEPDRLYFLTSTYTDATGNTRTDESFEYPTFRELRSAVKNEAELIAIGYSPRRDLTFSSNEEMEKAYLQYVSGWMFNSLGLKPALGRLLTRDDDLTPGAHPVAVLSHHYWTSRFGEDPQVVGRTFRMGHDLYEIVGVVERGFTGTETGTLTDIFVPTMMNAQAIDNPDWGWFRIWARLNRGVSVEQAWQKLQPAFTALRVERAKTFTIHRKRIEDFVNAPLALEPASAGVSWLQRNYRQALTILSVVVVLVLLIACANVANLMTAQAAGRAREMALRVSIGAGRRRLVELVLVESALIAFLAALLGGLFAWWSAPLVAGMINPPDDPVRLVLPADWRVLGFAAALTLTVTGLFGLAPALRASVVRPVSALKGGEDPHSRPRLMGVLVAVQMTFCFLVVFITGLFVATFDHLSNQWTGFSTERLLTLETATRDDQPVAQWERLMEQLQTVPGVEAASLCNWALMTGNGWSNSVWVNGERPDYNTTYFLAVSPGWLGTMEIPMIDGRDLRSDDVEPGAALVNEAFAKRYFEGRNPVGRSFKKIIGEKLVTTQIVGYVRDARYRNIREPIRPTAYVPLHTPDDEKGLRSGTFVIRTSTAEPTALAPTLRQAVSQAGLGFRVTNVRTQAELVRQHTIRERLLAILSVFFATVALLLSAIGLYGVLSYAVLQQRREIGIRLALGARAEQVARHVALATFGMLGLGALAGVVASVAAARYVETLLYQVDPTNLPRLVLPALTILIVAALAALPPIVQAARINPASLLRAE